MTKKIRNYFELCEMEIKYLQLGAADRATLKGKREAWKLPSFKVGGLLFWEFQEDMLIKAEKVRGKKTENKVESKQ